jgi:N-acetyl sugar amidotransferase
MPDTRPGIVIQPDGACNACKNNETKKNIDWEKRAADFEAVIKNAKRLSKGYDCIIPVSGGKDSTWQVIKSLEYGLNPLAVTWKTPARTKIGQQNLDNLISLGVDHIDYQINPKVEKTFMLKSLMVHGSTAIPMHLALFNIPLKIALKFEIPLVIWGENSAFEYGSDDDSLTGFRLNSAWLRRFGVTNNTTAVDWVGADLTWQELTPYLGVTDEELDSAKINAIFLGHYFPWDVETSLNAALSKGFKPREQGPKVGIYNYCDIDDDFISIHHFIKWYKFGITRAFDNLAIEIREGRTTREKALRMLKELGNQTPVEDIKKLCRFLDISENFFWEILEKFRNHDIWHDEAGVWKIRNFIIDDWKWV